MTIEEIRKKVKSIEGLEGMTVNERLYECGAMELFDEAKRSNKKFARSILQELQVDEESITKIVNEKLK
jgi:hypothetical protein